MYWILTIIIFIIFFFILWLILLFFNWTRYWLKRILQPGEHKRQEEIINLRQRLTVIRERMPYVNWYADDLEIREDGMKEMESLTREKTKIEVRLNQLRR